MLWKGSTSQIPKPCTMREQTAIQWTPSPSRSIKEAKAHSSVAEHMAHPIHDSLSIKVSFLSENRRVEQDRPTAIRDHLSKLEIEQASFP